mgnify:CR=1 FL=1
MDHDIIWEESDGMVTVTDLDTDQEMTLPRGGDGIFGLPEGVYRILRYWVYKGATGTFLVSSEERDGAAIYVTTVRMRATPYSTSATYLWPAHVCTVVA